MYPPHKARDPERVSCDLARLTLRHAGREAVLTIHLNRSDSSAAVAATDLRLLLARIAFTLLIAAAMFALTARAQEAFTGQWMIERQTSDSVQFTIRYSSDGWRNGGHWNSSWSTGTALAALQGLNTADLNSSAGTNVQFKVVRDAGTFDCTGWARGGDASGHWNFVPSATYAAELQKRGLNAPAPSEQFEMAMSDVTLSLVDELKNDGYHLDLTDLIRAGQHGVSLEYVRGMKTAGYKFDDLDALTKMRDHGVTPKYVQEMAAFGFKNLSADELRRLRDHGVTGEYMGGMEKAGYKGLSSDDAVRMRDHGVTPDFIAAMAQSGFKSMTAEELVRMRDHGVTPEFIAAMSRSGYKGMSAEELVRMRDRGVNAEYISGMVQAGYKDLSASDLSRLREHGVTPTYVQELAKAGLGKLDAQDLQRMRDHGVDASYIRDLKAAGVTTTDSADLVRLRDHGVTASFVREAKEHGFSTTDPDELIRLRTRGWETRRTSF